MSWQIVPVLIAALTAGVLIVFALIATAGWHLNIDPTEVVSIQDWSIASSVFVVAAIMGLWPVKERTDDR